MGNEFRWEQKLTNTKIVILGLSEISSFLKNNHVIILIDFQILNNRDANEWAAGMNLEESFYTMNGIDPDGMSDLIRLEYKDVGLFIESDLINGLEYPDSYEYNNTVGDIFNALQDLQLQSPSEFEMLIPEEE